MASEDFKKAAKEQLKDEYRWWFSMADNDTTGTFKQLLMEFQTRLTDKKNPEAFKSADAAKNWFTSELAKNEWWQSLTNEQRSSFQEQYNPATAANYQENVSDRADRIAVRARALGFTVDATTLNSLAVQAQRENWSDEETDQALRPLAGQSLAESEDNAGFGGAIGKAAADLANWSRLNGIEIDQGSADRLISSVAFGEMTLDQVKDNLRKQYMVGAFPGWQEQINAGLDVYDLSAPYRAIAQRMLGRSDMNMSDNTLRQMMQVQNADGTMGIRPLWEAEKYIRTLPEWQKTDDAYNTYANAGLEIGRMFGFR